jgi:hypothetical protein
MKLQKNLLLLIGISCLLFTGACVERQVSASGTANVPAEVKNQHRSVPPDANTKDYVHGWTNPTGDDSGKVTKSGNNKESRERMLPNETDSYRRAWTFPTNENNTPEDSSATPESHSDSQKVQPPPSDTEEFINGWTFE